MLKQGGEKNQSTLASEQAQKTEKIQPTKSESDAKKAALYHEIGTKIQSGELSPEETAGIVKTLLFQNDERMALRICTVAKLAPDTVKSLFRQSNVANRANVILQLDKMPLDEEGESTTKPEY